MPIVDEPGNPEYHHRPLTPEEQEVANAYNEVVVGFATEVYQAVERKLDDMLANPGAFAGNSVEEIDFGNGLFLNLAGETIDLGVPLILQDVRIFYSDPNGPNEDTNEIHFLFKFGKLEEVGFSTDDYMTDFDFKLDQNGAVVVDHDTYDLQRDTINGFVANHLSLPDQVPSGTRELFEEMKQAGENAKLERAMIGINIPATPAESRELLDRVRRFRLQLEAKGVI